MFCLLSSKSSGSLLAQLQPVEEPGVISAQVQDTAFVVVEFVKVPVDSFL